MSRFRNPSNGYEENVGQPWLWCLLLGPIYFAANGIWLHATTALLLAIGTGVGNDLSDLLSNLHHSVVLR